MEAFLVKFLPCLFIIVMMTSSIVADHERRKNKNGYSGRTLGTKNNTKDECNPQVGTGIRRTVIGVYRNSNQQCYTPFFVPGQGVGQPPVGLRGLNDPGIRYICQPPRPNQQPQQTYYATMFDEHLGIAVFSAYRLTQANAVFPGNQGQLGWCPTAGILNQGSDDIYRGQFPYQKGHLAPAHTFSNNRQRYVSTFTYTNAVPQCQSFNGGWWKRAENRIRLYAQHYCTNGMQPGTLYLITGPSFSRFDPNHPRRANDAENGLLNEEIWIPASMWTAGCCVRPNNQNTESFAIVGNNLQNQVPNVDRSLTRQVTVIDLQHFLGNDVEDQGFIDGVPNVRLFPGNQNCLTNTQLNILNLAAPGG